MYGVFQRKLIRPQQQGKWLRKYQNQNGNGDTDHRQRYQILRKELVSALRIFLPQQIGNDGGGAHGEDHRY